MAAGQNQGLQIALIIFVILTVLSMGFAVFTGSNVGELRTQLAKEREVAGSAQASFMSTQEELDYVKEMVGLTQTEGQYPDFEATKAAYDADLKKFGERLRVIDPNGAGAPASYSKTIDAILLVLEQRSKDLDAEMLKSADLQKQKDALEGTYKAQAEQFKKQADEAELARADVASKADAAEKSHKLAQTEALDKIAKLTQELEAQRAEMTKQIDDVSTQVVQLKNVISTKDEYIDKNIKSPDFAATYDGKITRVNPSTRTVWINLGTYDNLQKHLTFSVQPQGVPPGSKLQPKGRIEVMEILDNHLASCRIVEDDLSNPLLVGDSIYTPLWEPGQRTRFAFAGRIDLDGDNVDDIDRVRALVDRASGVIDSVVSETGQSDGELTIETRYLVLGPLPAQKEGLAAYNAVLAKAETLGVQRVPVSVFLDQIGYRRESMGDRIVFGGSSVTSPKFVEAPDGGPRVSTGSVNALFQQRRPPAAANGSAY